MTDSPELKLRQMMTGYWMSQAIYVAARLGIADLLAAGPRTVDELAEQSSSHAPSLYRLLRMMASLGLFRELKQGTFELTPLADPLRADAPFSQRPVALMMGEEHYRAWAELLHSVRTGECAFEHMYGQNVFDYLGQHPEQAQIFDAAMTGIHGRESPAMAEAYDLSDIGTLCDIGGGNGTLLATVLARYPKLRGILFDLPGVASRAEANLRKAGLLDRCRIEAGSFFEAVPAGADAYLMRHIIHDWDDARSKTILESCRRAIGPDGRLLLVESVIPPGNDPNFGKLLDVNMLVIPGGLERTEQQYRELLAASGFELSRIVPTKAYVDVIEARPVAR